MTKGLLLCSEPLFRGEGFGFVFGPEPELLFGFFVFIFCRLHPFEKNRKQRDQESFQHWSVLVDAPSVGGVVFSGDFVNARFSFAGGELR